MGDMGDDFRAMTEAKKERRAANTVKNSLRMDDIGIPYEVKNSGHHYIFTVGKDKFDYWPASDKWHDRRKSGQYRNGWGGLKRVMWALLERQESE